MAVDLGIINTAVTVDSDGCSTVYSGKQVLAVQHYFSKERAKLQSVLAMQDPKRRHSRALDVLKRKQSRQINQGLHSYSTDIVRDCVAKNVKVLVVGDLSNIRKGKDWGGKSNLKLHSWSFSKFTQQLEYKAVRVGIRFVRVNERDTSRTCSCCGLVRKANRVHRGMYRCRCGNLMNADVNGAVNILKKYLQPMLGRSIGDVASPSVKRLRNVVPNVREAHTF